jgi:hypothetical protein
LFGSLVTQASAIASPPGARMTTPHVVTTATSRTPAVVRRRINQRQRHGYCHKD